MKSESVAVLERHEPQAAPVVATVTPMTMLNMAVQQGADIEKLGQLMALQERWEANEAKKAFVEAMSAFKANPPAVYKDRENKQYDSRYTSIGNLVNTVNSALSQHGLSARWDVDQSAGIRVTCILTHRQGHSEQCSMSGPPDNSGKKNPLQEIKSTVTYLKVATFEAITGIASTDGNADDDGNGSGGSYGLTHEQRVGFERDIKEATDAADLATKWKAMAKACNEAKDRQSYDDLKGKVAVRGAEFKAAQ